MSVEAFFARRARLRQCEQDVHLQTNNTDVVKMSACGIRVGSPESGVLQETESVLIDGNSLKEN